ncbi:hypothetical protein BT93_F3071 [Corymbia citriodora subsp. variegata]|nr:hypothetical protein BT93_F3071 [Corymbia citriodora subsp. variegata]
MGKKKNKKKRKKNKLNPKREKDEEGGQMGEKGSGNTSGAEVKKRRDIPLSQVSKTWSSRNYGEAGNKGISLRASSANLRNSYEEAVPMKALQLPKLGFPELSRTDSYVHAQPIIDSIWSSLFTGSGYMTYTDLFVGGLALETHSETLRRYFEQFGDILQAFIATDKNTNRSKGYGYVTFRDCESVRRACENPSPIIDGRRAHCNLASLGQPQPPLPYGQLRPVTPTIGSVQAPRVSYVGSPVYHHPSFYGYYQPGYVYPPYGYHPIYGSNYVHPQAAYNYNPCMAQHHLQRYWAPSANSSDVCSFGQSSLRPLGNHGHPMLHGYWMPGQAAAVPTIRVPYPAGEFSKQGVDYVGRDAARVPPYP